MIDPLVIVLSGTVVAFISGSIGKHIGSNDKVKNGQCSERRQSCILLVSEKIDNLVNKVDGLKKAVDDKLPSG